ncbi:MAG: hypothetical protein ACMUJM_22120 [bacterium]
MNNLILGYIILGVLVFLTFFLANPKNFILLLIASSPIINIFWSFRISGFSIVDIFTGIFPILFIFILIKKNINGEWIWGKYNKFFILILLAYLIPLVRLILERKPSTNSLEFLLKILCGYASYNLIINFFNSNDEDRFIKAILCAVSIVMIMVSYQLITGKGTNISADYYIIGFYHDVGKYSRMALFGILIILPSLQIIKNRIDLIYKYILLTLCLITLYVAMSRNVILSIIAILIVYAFLWRKYFITMIIISIALGLFIFSPKIQSICRKRFSKEMAYIQHIKSNKHYINVDALGAGRVWLWKKAIKEFERSSFIEKIFGLGRNVGPHGQIIASLMSTGIYGLIITVLFYLKLLLDTFYKIRLDKNNLMAIYSFLINIIIFVMFIGSTPLTNYYLQMIFFSFVALTEKEEIEKKLCHEIEEIIDNISKSKNYPLQISGSLCK